jgi:hypothetical protein
VPFRLKVDNIPPRVRIATKRDGLGDHLTFRLSETSLVALTAPGQVKRSYLVAPGRNVEWSLPRTVHTASFVVVDRAGNQVARRLSW